MKLKNTPPRRSKPSGSSPGRALYTAFLAVSSLPLLRQQAMAATSVWEKVNEIMKIILGFLDEEAYKGPFSQNTYLANSKRQVKK